MDANTTSNTILVTGATGNVGGAVVAALREQGAQVRALVRDVGKAKALVDAGAEIAVGDLDRPETLDDAFVGVNRVFLATSVNPSAALQVENVIEVAKRSGNTHIVRLGAARASMEDPTIGRLHAQSDAALKESGLPFTVLAPQSFMQNTMMAAPTVTSEGAIYMPLKDGRLGLIDARDVVDAAVYVLTSAGHEGQTYTITGPVSMSFADVASRMSEGLGKEVTYIDIPLEACRDALTGMGLDEWTANAYVEYFDAFSQNLYDFVTDELETLTGKPPRTFEQFVTDFSEVFGGRQVTA